MLAPDAGRILIVIPSPLAGRLIVSIDLPAFEVIVSELAFREGLAGAIVALSSRLAVSGPLSGSAPALRPAAIFAGFRLHRRKRAAVIGQRLEITRDANCDVVPIGEGIHQCLGKARYVQHATEPRFRYVEVLGHLSERTFVELCKRSFVFVRALPVSDVLARAVLDIGDPEGLLVRQLLDRNKVIEFLA